MSIVPFFYQHFHDLSGKLAAAGRMHVYVAGSTIHKSIWTDVAMSVPRDNPMTLDGNGVAPQWFVGDGLVDIKVYTNTGSLIFTALNISGAAASGQLPWSNPTTGFLYFNEETGVYSWTDVPGDHKVKTHDADTPGFLMQKLLSNGAIHWELIDMGDGEFGLNPVLNEAVVTGDHKVAVGGGDVAPGYLSEKVATRTPDYLAVGLSAAGDAVSLDVLKAPPAGPAGGDLFGTYPDPRVKELTGIPSTLVIKEVPFNWLNPNIAPYNKNQWASGAGIGFGTGYVSSTKRKCWMACSQLGELWVSYDNFQTTVNESYLSLPSFGGLRYAGIYHVRMPGTIDYYWIFTANNGSLSLKDIPENFNANGTPIIDNMWMITFIGAADINAMAYSDSTLVFVGNEASIRYAEAADISVSGERLTITLHIATAASGFGGAVPSAVTGGIGFNGSTFIVGERDTGNLYTSADGKLWMRLAIGSCVYQDGSEVVGTVASDGVSFGHLSVIANRWSGILYANDAWVICNPLLYAGTDPDWLNYDAWTPYIFSYDGINWNAYQPTKEELAGSNAFKVSIYKAAYGDGLILATNQNPSQAADGQPAIYQMLIDQIAAHKRIVCEKGLTVTGSTYLLDLPGAGSLGTDSSGKIIAIPEVDQPIRIERFLSNGEAPPSSPITGAVYALAFGMSGVFAGHDNNLATWGGTSWTFIKPKDKQLAYCIGDYWSASTQGGLHYWGGDTYPFWVPLTYKNVSSYDIYASNTLSIDDFTLYHYSHPNSAAATRGILVFDRAGISSTGIVFKTSDASSYASLSGSETMPGEIELKGFQTSSPLDQGVWRSLRLLDLTAEGVVKTAGSIRLDAAGAGYLTALSILGLTNGNIPRVTSGGGLLGASCWGDNGTLASCARPLTLAGATRLPWQPGHQALQFGVLSALWEGPAGTRFGRGIYFDGSGFRCADSTNYPVLFTLGDAGGFTLSTSETPPVADAPITDLFHKLQASRAGGVGFFGAPAPTVRPAINAACTDLATCIALTNQLRAAMIACGLVQ